MEPGKLPPAQRDAVTRWRSEQEAEAWALWLNEEGRNHLSSSMAPHPWDTLEPAEVTLRECNRCEEWVYIQEPNRTCDVCSLMHGKSKFSESEYGGFASSGWNVISDQAANPTTPPVTFSNRRSTT